jgi:hypothetical protein
VGEFLAGVAVGASVVALIAIIVGPSRGVRRETGMDDEVETRLLLGLEPEVAADPVAEVDHPRDYDAAQIKELEDLAKAPKKRKHQD